MHDIARGGLGRERPLDPRPARRREPSREQGVGLQAANRSREGLGVARRHEQAGHLGGDRLVRAADGRGDDGPLGSHRLEDHDWEPFEEGREHDEVGRREEVGHIAALSQEHAPVGHAPLTRQGFELGADRAVAGEDESGRRYAGGSGQ